MPQDELPEGAAAPPIEAAATTVTLFVGATPPAPGGVTPANSFVDYLRAGGDFGAPLGEALRAFFRNGGTTAIVLGLETSPDAPPDLAFAEALAAGLVDGGAADGIRFNLLCVPGFSETETVKKLQSYCAARRAFLIVDAPQEAGVDEMLRNIDGFRGPDARNAAIYFPWLKTETGVVPPCGFVAGVYARTDVWRGVWKTPAGPDAPLRGDVDAVIPVDQRENEQLNPTGVNCLRSFPGQGLLVWGARTLAGDADWRYVPVRRFALFIEQSLYDGLGWVVFEPNDEPLWARIRLAVETFLHGLFRTGALQGVTAQQAYFVRCDRTTMTQQDIDAGIVNVVVGFAPTRPAEFVVIVLSLRSQP